MLQTQNQEPPATIRRAAHGGEPPTGRHLIPAAPTPPARPCAAHRATRPRPAPRPATAPVTNQKPPPPPSSPLPAAAPRPRTPRHSLTATPASARRRAAI